MDLKCLMLVSLVHLYMQIEHSTGYILTQSQIVNLYAWEHLAAFIYYGGHVSPEKEEHRRRSL